MTAGPPESLGEQVLAAGGRIQVQVDVYLPAGTRLESLRMVGELSQLDPRRHECEAAIYLTLARSSWRRADQLRAAAARKARAGGGGSGAGPA